MPRVEARALSGIPIMATFEFGFPRGWQDYRNPCIHDIPWSSDGIRSVVAGYAPYFCFWGGAGGGEVRSLVGGTMFLIRM